eukprot:c30536_g1_i1 orf=2-196(-)
MGAATDKASEARNSSVPMWTHAQSPPRSPPKRPILRQKTMNVIRAQITKFPRAQCKINQLKSSYC